MDTFLKRGGNEENSTLRICAHYQEGWQTEDRLRFLRWEFCFGGRGLIVNGKPYAAWFDESGIRVASGHSARYVKRAGLVSWEQMDVRLQP